MGMMPCLERDGGYPMKKITLAACAAFCLLVASASAKTVLPREPARGDASTSSGVFFAEVTLEGKKCAKGQVWQITPGSYKQGKPRGYTCVRRPAK